jgi:hypothetical protein
VRSTEDPWAPKNPRPEHRGRKRTRKSSGAERVPERASRRNRTGESTKEGMGSESREHGRANRTGERSKQQPTFCGRRKDGVSKRNDAAKDSMHAYLLSCCSTDHLRCQRARRDERWKRNAMEGEKIQVTMTHDKTEGSEAFSGVSTRKQQTTINGTTYLTCGERQPLNAVAIPPNRPSSTFSMLPKLSKMK